MPVGVLVGTVPGGLVTSCCHVNCTHSGTLTSFYVLNADDLPGTKYIVSPVGQMLLAGDIYPPYPRRC